MNDHSEGWPVIPDGEMPAFYATADGFLNAANGLVGEEPADRVAAAFIYAQARFAAFAMEAQTGDRKGVGIPARDWLTDRFSEELRDHMLQKLRSDASVPAMAGQVPDAALDVLMGINEMDPDDRTRFMRLGDKFIQIANNMIGDVAIARISAAMMHACTRFNAYVLQTRGLMPGPPDEEIVTDFRGIFRSLLDFHLQESMIVDREQ